VAGDVWKHGFHESSLGGTVDDAPLIEPSRRYRSGRLSATQGPLLVSAQGRALADGGEMLVAFAKAGPALEHTRGLETAAHAEAQQRCRRLCGSAGTHQVDATRGGLGCRGGYR
jgi:hypothetical protein